MQLNIFHLIGTSFEAKKKQTMLVMFLIRQNQTLKNYNEHFYFYYFNDLIVFNCFQTFCTTTAFLAMPDYQHFLKHFLDSVVICRS
jgi:hypothetical protein